MASIKVNRLALITELEAAKQRLLDGGKALEAEWAAYDKALDEWSIKVVKVSKKFRTNQWNDYVEVYAPADLPKPKRPSENRPEDKRYFHETGRRSEYTSLNELTARKVAEIDNTLKLLKLSSEDSVSTTAYKSVAQYL